MTSEPQFLIKNIISFIALSVLFSSCKSSKSLTSEMIGIYSQDDNESIELIINDEKFSLIEIDNGHPPIFTCCDTITTGIWNRKGKLLFFSTPQLQSPVIPIVVEESHVEFKDTIIFYLNSPIERYYKGYTNELREIKYRIAVTSSSGTLLNSWINEYNSNIIKLVKPQGVSLGEFTINAYPNDNFRGRNIGTRVVTTELYKIQNKSSNKFVIDIPNLSLEYLTYLRLEKDIIKIHNKNTLEWDGHFYYKK